MLFEAAIREALTPPPALPDPLAEARRRHRPVRHILKQRQTALHEALQLSLTEAGHEPA